MDIFLFILAYIGIFGLPILGIIFGLNLVEVIKKIKNEQPTAANTFWLTASFILIAWTTALLPLQAVN